jgi:hypothetical protein
MTDFQKNPRDYALQLVEDGMVDPILMLTAALKWMSTDDVQEMLDANELSPRFEEDEDDGQPTEQEEWLDFDPDC